MATLPAPTDRLGQLRPVSFHLKSEPQGTLQYGLIAEEVAKIYPELVLHDQSGQIQGVRYDELAPLLLSEVQEQRRTISDLQQQLAAQAAAQVLRDSARDSELDTIKHEFAQLQEGTGTMQMAVSKLQDGESRVVMH
jgi:endosialidase-like protein